MRIILVCRGGLDQATCTATAGCYYGNECLPCEQGDYCPSGEADPKPCSGVGDASFTESEQGAGSANECYKSQSCNNNDSNVDDCKHYYGDLQSGAVYCPNATTANAHLEGNLCYYNNRNCSLFTNKTNCSDGTVDRFTGF